MTYSAGRDEAAARFRMLNQYPFADFIDLFFELDFIFFRKKMRFPV